MASARSTPGSVAMESLLNPEPPSPASRTRSPMRTLARLPEAWTQTQQMQIPTTMTVPPLASLAKSLQSKTPSESITLLSDASKQTKQVQAQPKNIPHPRDASTQTQRMESQTEFVPPPLNVSAKTPQHPCASTEDFGSGNHWVTGHLITLSDKGYEEVMKTGKLVVAATTLHQDPISLHTTSGIVQTAVFPSSTSSVAGSPASFPVQRQQINAQLREESESVHGDTMIVSTGSAAASSKPGSKYRALKPSKAILNHGGDSRPDHHPESSQITTRKGKQKAQGDKQRPKSVIAAVTSKQAATTALSRKDDGSSPLDQSENPLSPALSSTPALDSDSSWGATNSEGKLSKRAATGDEQPGRERKILRSGTAPSRKKRDPEKNKVFYKVAQEDKALKEGGKPKRRNR